MDSLINGFDAESTRIPPVREIFKISAVVPLCSLVICLVGLFSVFFGVKGNDHDLYGYFNYLISDGWIVVLPTIIIGLFFFLMSYNNVIPFLMIPKKNTEDSIVIQHLLGLVRKTILIFLTLMLLSSLVACFYPILAFSVPVLELVLFFAINIVVGSEINRLGAAFAFEKIAKLMKKI